MNKYEIIELVGSGAYGNVYKARHIESNELVAIKILKNHSHIDYLSIEEINNMKEIKSLKQLKDHKNLIKLKEVFVHVTNSINNPKIQTKQSNLKSNLELCLVFEYAHNSLRDIMEKIEEMKEKIPEQRIKSIIYQMALGIEYIHKSGYFHRDIKPDNIMLKNNEIVKIADFGFCCSQESFETHELTEYICTRFYRAPECLLKFPDYNTAIDIWGLGVVMAELYLLRPLFEANSEIEQFYEILKFLGTPKTNEWGEMYKYANLLNLKIPLYKKNSFSSLIPEISSQGVDLLHKLLILNPKSRPDINSVLNHPYFDELKYVKSKKIKIVENVNMHGVIPVGYTSPNISPKKSLLKRSIFINPTTIKELDQPPQPISQMSLLTHKKQNESHLQMDSPKKIEEYFFQKLIKLPSKIKFKNSMDCKTTNTSSNKTIKLSKPKLSLILPDILNIIPNSGQKNLPVIGKNKIFDHDIATNTPQSKRSTNFASFKREGSLIVQGEYVSNDYHTNSHILKTEPSNPNEDSSSSFSHNNSHVTGPILANTKKRDFNKLPSLSKFNQSFLKNKMFARMNTFQQNVDSD
jgi:serine/threonine protein kinase